MKILFQGDSITHSYRQEEYPWNMGMGYPAYVAGRLGLEEPGEHQFINRGVSGDRIVDVYARVKKDIINLKPDYMSLLIGVNDVWHELLSQNGVATEKFEKVYAMLLEEVKAALPKLKIVLLEPFVLPGAGTNEHYCYFREQVEDRAKAVRRLAERFDLPLIPLQADLDEMAKQTPEGYWLVDGVHPSVYGHQYIADKWIALYKTIKG